MNVLRRRWGVIALVTAFAVIGTLVGFLVSGRSYVSTATLRVPVATANSTVQPDTLDYSERLINTYKQIAESPALRDHVQRQLGGEGDVSLTFEPVPSTELIAVSARANRPELAQRAANIGAAVVVERVRARSDEAQRAARERIEGLLEETEQRLRELRGLAAARREVQRAQLVASIRARELRYEVLTQQAVALDVASESRTAVFVEEPASGASGAWAGVGLNTILGLVLGLVAGVGVAFFLERRTPQLDTLNDIERAAGTRVLGTIPSLDGGDAVIFNGALAEQQAFGNLRARLLSRDAPTLPYTMLITSAHEGDGKSLIAANLAAALARAHRRVLLIDGNLRQPSLHRFFGLENDRGLRDVLEHETGMRDRLAALISDTNIVNLSVLTSGQPSAAAAELLASPRMAEAIQALTGTYEVIVIDSSGLEGASDAAALASHVDAVLFVVGGTPVRDDVVQSAFSQLEGVGARTIGVVVNRWGSERAGVMNESGDAATTRLSYQVAKRAMDVVLGSAAIVVLSPLLAAVGLVIVIDSGLPVLFVQQRVGARPRRRGHMVEWEVRPFRMLKFRTMVRDAHRSTLHQDFMQALVAGEIRPVEAGDIAYKLAEDPRVTRVGQFLRASSLDELPQLLNVLVGTMSLVGPRPVPPYEVAAYEERHMRRLAALPGITGLWQVDGRGRTSFEEGVRIDLEYVSRQSLWLDVRLLMRTVPAVLSRRGAR